MGAQMEFRQALETGDFQMLRRVWGAVAPHLPQPTTDAEAEITMHAARTATASIDFTKRAWSHRWLTERNFPSNLPDELRPSAEQVCPRKVDAVGISVNTGKEWLRPAMLEVRGAMELAVEDCFANGDKDPDTVKGRMVAARNAVMRKLFGGGR